jgi:DNA-binding beta-propeller fold protein YncE
MYPKSKKFSLMVFITAAVTAIFPLNSAAEFVAFESGQVRPLAISPDGNRLFAVNTPDNRLEIYNLTATGIVHAGSVPVGMEPVAVAARSNNEIWVTNHLSDSVSIVVMSGLGPAHVLRTLHVGDEPRDIVFAGAGNKRAFITTAHRDLNRAPSSRIGNADVWVFDTDNLGSSVGGDPMTIINLFTDVPRALAVSSDGNTVYAASYFSGNRTTVIGDLVLQEGDLPPPLTNVDGVPAPPTGLIVKYDGAEWRDNTGRIMTDKVRISLPDLDVFTIDAASNPPQLVSSFPAVGTVLFNMVVNPVSGKVYVSNLESRNHVRFEGPGEFGGSTVRGHIAESRITVIDSGNNSVSPRHLNKHINYDVFPGTSDENGKSLAFPLQMVVSPDGKTLYVAALGSSKVGIFDVAKLEDDSFVPSEADHIEISGGGPTGLVLDSARNRLYVMTRFDNSISVVSLVTKREIAHVSSYNPEPASITEGRRFLYDARYTSSRGDSACASCHIFADNDALAWDLGNPDASVQVNPNPFKFQEAGVPIDFHPMKGPMTTQSLRGMANHGPLHWRGDRTAGNDPGGDPLDEHVAFTKFNGAFEGLVGRTAPLTDQEIESFANFALQIMYPPNPNRDIGNVLTAAQQRGHDFYMNEPVEVNTGFTCNHCHVLDPIAGFFGTDGLSSTRSLHPGSPVLKVPHLRNVYTKLSAGESPFPAFGDQARGFFLSHDGSGVKLFTFLQSPQFDFPGGNAQRQDLITFLRVFDTNLAPVVGQQVTLSALNGSVAKPRISLFMNRAAVSVPRPECDIIVKGNVNGEERGWLRLANNAFRSDRSSENLIGRVALEAIAQTPGQELTFTCVPPGSGLRMAVDRDEDGHFDRDEIDAGSDPSDPVSVPL